MQTDLKNLIDSLHIDKILNENEIPNIELYMDQLTTFLNENLTINSKNDKVLTKSIINNYTKDKVLPPPIKKKYSKNHIMILILICNMKQVLSINDIKTFTSHLDEDTLKVYKSFIDIKTNINKNFEDDIYNIISKNNKINIENDEIYLLLFSLIIESANKKMLAEKIIEVYFNNQEK